MTLEVVLQISFYKTMILDLLNSRRICIHDRSHLRVVLHCCEDHAHINFSHRYTVPVGDFSLYTLCFADKTCSHGPDISWSK